MGENSKIAWTDHTFNPWWACSKVSAECANCYAETLARRFGFGWGESAEPRFFGAKHWNEPLRWNREAEQAGKRAKVFCGSMCDVFEDREAFKPHRDRLWELIFKTPMLDWLLLTKRPENFALMRAPIMDNIWKGTTAGTDETLRAKLPHLLAAHGVKFLSMEPLLEDVDIGMQKATCKCCPRRSSRWVSIHRTVRSDVPFGDYGTIAPGIYRASSNPHGALSCVSSNGSDLGIRPSEFTCLPGLDWVIVGGESGPKARPCDVEWIRSIVEQCRGAGVPVFVKQLGANIWNPKGPVFHPILAGAGADPAEWPEDLRIREFPKEAR